jgi:hypothetical protein
MTTRHPFCLAVVLTASITLAGRTSAGTIVVPSFDRGWVSSTGGHQATVDNYAAKGVKSTSTPNEYRNFFVFDLTGLKIAPAPTSLCLMLSGIAMLGLARLFRVFLKPRALTRSAKSAG